jgi:hypothetical protein
MQGGGARVPLSMQDSALHDVNGSELPATRAEVLYSTQYQNIAIDET